MNARFGVFLSFLALLFATHAIASQKCNVCGMAVKEGAPTSFESRHEGKALHFCSYVCAHSFHQQFPKSPLWAHDFGKAKRGSEKLPRIAADKAYYLVKSEQLEKYLKDEAMPPSIVAFSFKADAEKFLKEMTEAKGNGGATKAEDQGKKNDGEIVQGFDAVEKKY